MAWTDPATWATSELVTAAKMNTHVRDNLDFLYPARAVYETATAQSFTTSVSTIVRYDTVVEDPDSAVTTGAAWKYTAPFAGLYAVHAGLLWASSAAWAGTGSETSSLVLYKNGSFHRNLTLLLPTSPTQFVNMNGSAMVRLAVNDTVDIRATQVTGGNLALHTDATYNHVDICRLSG